MRFRNVLCFGMAAVLVCSNLPANVAQAESLQTKEWTEEMIQERADWELATETMIEEEIKGADNGSEQETKSGWKYKTLKDGTLEITGYSGKKTSLTLPSKIGGKKVSSIGKFAFGYSKLKSVKIPGTVKNIEGFAFAYCSSLKSIKIPNGVTSIGDSAFFFCVNLKSVELPKTLKKVGNNSFWGTSIKSLTIPKNLTKIGDYAFRVLRAIKVQNGNPAYCAQDGVLFTKDKKTLIFCPMQKKGNYTVPRSVKRIGTYAFYASALKNIKLQKGLTTIVNSAFWGSGIKSIVLPEGLKTIGRNAFNNCNELKSVTIPKSVTKIGENAFGSWSWCVGMGLKLKVVRGSYAQKWAKTNNIPYSYIK